MLLWIKQRLIYLNLKRNGTGNGSSNITNTSTERFLLKNASSACQCMCISKIVLSGSKHVCEEHKDKVPDSHQKLEHRIIPKSSHQNLKICVSKKQKN